MDAILYSSNLVALLRVDLFGFSSGAPRPCSGDGPQVSRDASLVLSFPGLGPVIAATILSEAAQPVRARDYSVLRVRWNSSRYSPNQNYAFVPMRQACSTRMRNAVYHWLSHSIQWDALCCRQFNKLRAAGHVHARTLREVADRLLAILVAVLKSGKPYDPALRAA